jgi:hypothetical protein
MHSSGRTLGRVSAAISAVLVAIAIAWAGVAVAQPYGVPDDIAAYEAQAGRPFPPGGPYLGASQIPQLKARLEYAEARYDDARRMRDRAAARHWKKQIKHLRRELAERHVAAERYGAPLALPPQTLGSSSSYPAASSWYPQGPSPAYPPSYGSSAYPGAYGPAGAANPSGTGALSTMMGALLGRSPAGAMPASGYPMNGYPPSGYQTGYGPAGYPQAGSQPSGGPASGGSMGDAVSSLLGSMGGAIR